VFGEYSFYIMDMKNVKARFLIGELKKAIIRNALALNDVRGRMIYSMYSWLMILYIMLDDISSFL